SVPPDVGALLYDASGSVLESRPAVRTTRSLDAAPMLASLRKPEYTKMVRQLVGFVPQTTPVFCYKACLEVLQLLPVEEVQSAYCAILKERIDNTINTYLSHGELPSFLNFSFYQSKFDKYSYLTMINNLSKNLL